MNRLLVLSMLASFGIPGTAFAQAGGEAEVHDWVDGTEAPEEAMEPPAEAEPAAEPGDGAPAEPFELPRPPQELDAVLAVEVHVSIVSPVLRDPLCPPEADCVFGGGGGVGGSLERRWPTGMSLGLAYDAWFVDSNNIYELAVMQMLSARVRYYFMQDTALHPHLGLGAGALTFGDTLRFATVGFAVEASVGGEWEVTESIAVSVAMPWRLFTTSSFQTTRDRVQRAEEAGINLAVSLQIGLTIVETP